MATLLKALTLSLSNLCVEQTLSMNPYYDCDFTVGPVMSGCPL